MFPKKFAAPILPVSKLPKLAPAPGDIPTRPTLHAKQAKTPLTAQDPELLEKSLLRRMNRFG